MLSTAYPNYSHSMKCYLHATDSLLSSPVLVCLRNRIYTFSCPKLSPLRHLTGTTNLLNIKLCLTPPRSSHFKKQCCVYPVLMPNPWESSLTTYLNTYKQIITESCHFCLQNTSQIWPHVLVSTSLDQTTIPGTTVIDSFLILCFYLEIKHTHTHTRMHTYFILYNQGVCRT